MLWLSNFITYDVYRLLNLSLKTSLSKEVTLKAQYLKHNSLKTSLSKAHSLKHIQDCGSKFPIWASASFGTMICLKCAGAHRGLGVHVSYVRSLPLDSWKAESLRRMKTSWNEKVLNAFKESGMPFERLSIKQRYNSNVAKAYREQLARYCKRKKRKKHYKKNNKN